MPKDEVIFGRTKAYLEKAGIPFEVGELGKKKMFRVKKNLTCDRSTFNNLNIKNAYY